MHSHCCCRVPSFEASRYPVTNGEFMQFVLAGGYETRSYWSEEGWHWVNYRQARHPTFWVCSSGCKSGCGGDLAGYSHCGSACRNKQMHCNGHIQVDGNGHHGSDEGGGDNLATYRCAFVASSRCISRFDVSFHTMRCVSGCVACMTL